MRAVIRIVFSSLAMLLGIASIGRGDETNLLADPSFEMPGEKAQFGHVFPKWSGWKYEGDCEFRVGRVAHSGKTSCLLFGVASPKIRIAQEVDVEPGRYRITAWLRGLDVGTGRFNVTTEFMFDDKYVNLKKNGTFGWTKLTYVADVKEKKRAAVSFGTWASGYFWIDDVSLVKVGNDVPPTEEPALGKEESPKSPAGDLPRMPFVAPNAATRTRRRERPVSRAALDAEIKLAKELGFLAVNTYGGGVSGSQAYSVDTGAMTSAGFKDYSDFLRVIYAEIQKHADANGWLPVYYNIGDEPDGDELIRSAENAEAYRKAFPKGPPYFSAPSSFTGNDRNDPHRRLGKALHVVNWNLHDEQSVKLIHELGGDWAFYNGGDRWTFGDYLYKAAKQFGMKFRLNWHWNAAAGDPYYALDCREDDDSWCAGSPDGQLLPSVYFEQLREGPDDYRRLITLARLAKEKADTPAAKAARELIEERMAAFKLNQRDHAALFPPGGWTESRRKIDDAIEALRK